MNTFANAVRNQEARTQNGMKARASTADAVVDLFFKIGASRGKDIVPAFVAAYNADRNLALRVALWARDVRGGAGERKLFRDILSWLEKNDKDAAIAVINKAPEVGRWDDILGFTESDVKLMAFNKVKEALETGNGLAAKWMPRKGPLAAELRNFLGWTPKRYRKTLVNLTKVVETQMCAKNWNEINFSHVPSVAMKRYRKAFYKNAKDMFEAYVEAVKAQKVDPVTGKVAKINASAIFPHDVIRGHLGNQFGYRADVSAVERDVVIAQWNALPNYIEDGNILPIVDVSGSMASQVDKSGLRAIDVSVSLGLYCAEKNKGKFHGTFLTFSDHPQLVTLKGNVLQMADQMVRADWEMSTNLHAAFEKILKVAKDGNVPEAEMPKTLLILSDMQFNSCVRHDDSAIEMIRRKYEAAGYELPKVVFWNLNAHDNVPVKFDESGTALVSGFSPSVLKAVLANDMEQFTPRAIMLKTIMSDRYAV